MMNFSIESFLGKEVTYKDDIWIIIGYIEDYHNGIRHIGPHFKIELKRKPYIVAYRNGQEWMRGYNHDRIPVKEVLLALFKEDSELFD